ncbi:hypothetical protein [Metaclostridioides mangenotii]|uniref:hypothetical protein n=1 Tax=Metaclostridioides mangenotii TaxID=1540 RepID=UPI0028E3AB17|nr:hypothetical protein [Clostridioides mangenotii]
MKKFLNMWLMLLVSMTIILAICFGLFFLGSLIFKSEVGLIIFIFIALPAVVAFIDIVIDTVI